MLTLDDHLVVPLAFKPRAFDFDNIYRDVRQHGESIADMVRSIPVLPARFWTVGEVCVNGELVPRAMWHSVRPKATSAERPIVVTMHMPLGGGGGGGGGGKGSGLAILGIVAALALTIVTAGISSGLLLGAASNAIAVGLGTTLGVTVSGAVGQAVLAGAVGIVGALAISALTAPPAVQSGRTARSGASAVDDAREAASASGNVIEPGGAIPRVLGTRKVFPVLACEPVTELVGTDEIVEAIYILNGPHQLTNIRVGDSEITEAQDITYITKEGWPDDYVQTFITRQGRTTTPQIEMSTHQVDSENPDLLKDPAHPDRDIPVWHTVAGRSSPDEIWLHLLLPQGLSLAGSTTNDQSIPFRIQMKRRGGTWKNLPELHISDRTLSQIRKAVVIKFSNPPSSTIPTVPSQKGFVAAYAVVPDSVVVQTFPGWTADASFSTGGGTNFLIRSNEGTTSVKNVWLFDNRAEIYLDATAFPPGTYDIRIKRGFTYDTSNFVKSTYVWTPQGFAITFFEYYLGSGVTPKIQQARQNLAEQVYLTRVVSIWNQQPVPIPGFAMIALKARNRRIEAVSTVASGYVRDWDGSGWNTWTTTGNPAAHYVDILTGALNLDPLPSDLMDSASLVAWRTLCASQLWRADIIVDDYRTQDALQLLASCGYARPYQSEVYGVTVDKDRSGDVPMQVFSPRNSSGFRFDRAFAKLPDGFRVTYRDVADDYNDAETVVYRTGYLGGDAGIIETVNYDGLVDLSKVQARARFDLDQAEQRSTFYYLDADAEAILCRRGDLVAVQHDTISRRQGSGYVKTKILSGGNIVGLKLDQSMSITNELNMHAVTDMHAVLDMHLVGRQTGIALRRTDATISMHALANGTGETQDLFLATPIANVATIEGFVDTGGESGCLVVSGDVGTEYRRLLVSVINANADLTFSLTLVDEAPALVRG
jgi:hypothetical protein